jgi:GNAT superfamily N-acetyltransferase
LGQLADARIAHWRADRDGEAAGWLRIGPANEDASSMVQDAGTASITGAYVAPRVRGQGVMTALLDRALASAREEGYERCAVDLVDEPAGGSLLAALVRAGGQQRQAGRVTGARA